MSLIRKQWFLIVLLLALAGGYFFAGQLGGLVAASWLKWTVVAVTMFLMAWPLEFGKLYGALAKPLAPLLATGVNFVLIPLLAWPISKLLGADLGSGLIVAAAVPSTLASGAVWTRRAGGDDSVAVVVTLLTNSTCFFVTPLLVYLMLGGRVEPGTFQQTIFKLLYFVVLPMALGQIVRVHKPTAAWATRNKPKLSTAAMFGVLFMVLVGSAVAGQKVAESESSISIGQILMMTVAVAVVHLVGWAAGFYLAGQCNIPRDRQIAVAFSGSQKTLMAGLSTAISMGLNIIPMVAYHAVQLIIDTVLADRLKANSTEPNMPNEPNE